LANELKPRIRHRLDPNTYQERTFANLGGAIISRIEVSSIQDKLESSDRTILEVGTGPGRITRELIKREAQIVGIDLDERMLRHIACRNRSRRNCDLVVADGQVLPFREEVFDVVICIRVMKYLGNPARGLREIGAVLKTEGKLILEFPNLLGLSGIFQSMQRIVLHETFPRLFKCSSVQRQLTEIGLRIITTNHLFKIPPVIWIHSRSIKAVRVLGILDSILQKITHPEVITKSTILLAKKSPLSQLKKDEILVKSGPGFGLLNG